MTRKNKGIINKSKVDICGNCGSSNVHVVDVRIRTKGRKQRRKECNDCKSRWSTVEILLTDFVHLDNQEIRKEIYVEIKNRLSDLLDEKLNTAELKDD